MGSVPLAILTRPAGRNGAPAQALRARGWQVLELPALAVAELPRDARSIERPDGYDLVVFVSGTAVRCYMKQLGDVAGMQHWPAGVAAACVGPATARALRASPIWDAGATLLHPEAQDGSYDSESLWRLMQQRGFKPSRVLLVRGTAGRDWLAERLAGEGATVVPYAAYRREPAAWPDAALALLAACRDQDRPAHWLLTSGEGMDAVHAGLARAGLSQWWQSCRFVLTHERLAPRLEALVPGASARGMVKICLPEDAAIVQAFCS